MDGNTIFIIFLVIAAILLICASIHLNDKNKNPGIDLNKVFRQTQPTQNTHYLLEIYPMLIEYVRNRAVKDNTRNMGNPSVQEVSDFIKNNHWGFEERLKTQRLMDNRGMLQTDNINIVANEFYQYYQVKYCNRQTMPLKRNTAINAQQTILSDGISPSEFFKLRKTIQGDVVGVYILLNINKCKHYVGQAKRVYFRVNQHFTGKGNPEVYADFMYGNNFRIKIIRLGDSGYYDLDKLEKDMIAKYDAYHSGYNKTVGNGG